MNCIQLILALCMGISLSAACGFRVFVPLLAVSLAVRYGGVSVNDTFAWVGTDAAFICLSVATVVEILAYYIPVVDHALDVVNTPLALVAGAIITCGMLPDMPDFAQWGIGIVGGAGAAGVIQAGTAAVRGMSSATTVTLGNPIVSSLENIFSILGSILAILVPALAIIGVLIMSYMAYRIIRRLRQRAAARPAP